MSEQTQNPEQEVELNEEISKMQADVEAAVEAADPVSYTHLTLPTILHV